MSKRATSNGSCSQSTHLTQGCPFASRLTITSKYTIGHAQKTKKLTGYIATTAPSGADPSTKRPSPAPGTPDALTTVVKPSSERSISFSSFRLQASVESRSAALSDSLGVTFSRDGEKEEDEVLLLAGAGWESPPPSPLSPP